MYRWWLIALAGCYRPAAIDDCQVACGANGGLCPPGQICDDTGRCRSADRGSCDPDEIPIDAFEQLDAPTDAPNPGQVCFGGFFPVCIDPSVPDRTFPAAVTEIDTTNPMTACTFVQPQSQPPNVCVIAANNIIVALGATVRLVGPLPVAFVARDTISIAGTIDASSRQAARRGAGGGTGPCNAAALGVKATANGGGGGGAGGAMVHGGGKGGAGTGGSGGGLATAPVLDMNLKWVRGGCAGGNGGTNANGLGAGGGAPGGGAVHFVARMAVELTATAVINASGAGGDPAGPRGGGGGGGSGGFIGFQAATYAIDQAARIFAIGGAGSAGGGNTTAGAPGNEATGPEPTEVTMGTSGGGNGGFGAALAGDAGSSGIPSGGATAGGGGGGGGGGGLIGAQGGVFSGGIVAPPIKAL